jgi:hypothetical protein
MALPIGIGGSDLGDMDTGAGGIGDPVIITITGTAGSATKLNG